MPRKVPGEPYTRVTAEEANALVKKGDAHVIDVRRPDEYEAGHVKGALWIQVDEVIPRYDELPRQGKLLFICAMGARSGLACEYAAAITPIAAAITNDSRHTTIRTSSAWITGTV